MKKAASTSFDFPSMAAASAASGIPYDVLKAWKGDGFPGFDRSGRVDLKAVLSAVFAVDKVEGSASRLPEGFKAYKDWKTAMEASRLELRLQHDRGELVERKWVCSAINRMDGEIEHLRQKSEIEHAQLFAATNGDTAQCRAILERIWTEIKTGLRGLGKHLEEGKDK